MDVRLNLLFQTTPRNFFSFFLLKKADVQTGMHYSGMMVHDMHVSLDMCKCMHNSARNFAITGNFALKCLMQHVKGRKTRLALTVHTHSRPFKVSGSDPNNCFASLHSILGFVPVPHKL